MSLGQQVSAESVQFQQDYAKSLSSPSEQSRCKNPSLMFHFVVKIFLSVGMVANTCMTLANKYLFWSIHPHGTVLMDVSLIDGTFKLSPSHIKKDRSKNTQYFWDLHGIIKVILLNNLRLSTMDFAGHLKVQLYNGTKAVCLCGPQLIVHSICAGIHGNIVSTGQPCYAYCWSIGNARFWSANHVESILPQCRGSTCQCPNGTVACPRCILQ